MKFLLLTRHEDETKQLVNMSLVSEAIKAGGTGSFTNLVVPTAHQANDRLIAVVESPEEIAGMLAEKI
jgi:hypothetical protein